MTKPHPAHGAWRKSMACESDGCVEVAFGEHSVLVRQSLDRSGPVLSFSLAEWAAFLTGVRNGEFDQNKTNPDHTSNCL